MNKTININIGGIFFHIDEKAYLKLNHYLEAVRNSLLDDAQGKEEILKDIEQRISELFSVKITKDRQVINEKDVEDVISVMGQPEDYQFEDETTVYKKSEPKKGIRKKLYRDGKDKILGGVASGLANYVGIDATWMRIILIILLFPGGLSIWTYLILWIIVPEAKTTTEELEMKGEPINIDSIGRKIKDEYTRVEDSVKNADYSGVRNGFQQILDALSQIIRTIFNVFGKFIGVLIIIISSLVLIGLVVGLFSWGTVEIFQIKENVFQFPEFFEVSILPRWILSLALFIALLIPLVFLFILGLNIISNKKTGLGKTANLSLLGIWIISIFAISFAGIEFGTQFSNENYTSENKQYTLKEKDTLFVRMIGNDLISNRKSLYRSNNLEEINDESNKKKLYSSYVHLDIRRSSTNQLMVKVLKTSKGLSKEKARIKSENIEYKYQFDRNKLILDSYFLTTPDLKYSSPKIDIILYIPENKVVYLDHSTGSFLYDVTNLQDIYDTDMANHYFIMNNEGFNCLDCNESEIEKIELDINKGEIKVNIDNVNDKSTIKVKGNSKNTL